jgi:flagellar biosynthesis/type III secretory pathway M-ring protein FliF/YscJ
MSTLQIVSIVANVILAITVLSFIYPKVIQSYTKYKKQRERKGEQRRQAENARLVKTIRTEVRRYLEELQK